jgi:hypothetical protein
MTREEYKRVAYMRKHIAPFFHPESPVNSRDPSYNDDVGKAVKEIRENIHDTRAGWRLGQITKETPSKIIKLGHERYHGPTQQRIKRVITDRFYTGRTDVEVRLGTKINAEKIPKEARNRWARGPIVEISVGHMWERKVYNEFYRDKNLDSAWFVLSANQVRVNKKHQFKLFEAMLFRPDLNEMREGYVVKATIGKEQADIAFTVANAVEKGLQILDQAVREKVIQKEDNHDQ